MKDNDMIAVGPACSVELRGTELVYVSATDKVNVFRKRVALPAGVSGGSVVKLDCALGLITVRTRDELHVYSFNVRKWTVAARLVEEEVSR